MNFQSLFRRILPPYFQTQKSSPDFIVIGSRMTGMQWLARQLQSNPRVSLVPIGEPHHFDYEFLPGRRTSIDRTLKNRMALLRNEWSVEVSGHQRKRRDLYLDEMERQPPHSAEWYKKCYQFPRSRGKLIGEVSPSYLMLPEQGVRAIRSYVPKVKIVMVVSNPVHNVIDTIRRNLSRQKQSRLSALDWQKLADDPNLYKPTEYSRIIPIWDETFGKQITYLPFELMIQEPQEFSKQLFKFLGLKIRENQVIGRPSVKGMEVPPQISKVAAARTDQENQYLKTRFPAEFCSLC